jgi:hypothetical protein
MQQYQEDKVRIHCTDNDQYVDAVIVSRNQFGIVMSLQNGNIRLTFKKMPNKNLYVASKGGYEFVYNPTQ